MGKEKEIEKEQEITTESRRKFLKAAGIFAVYTPPALMLMSNANATYVKDTTGKVKKYRKYKRYLRKGNNGYGNGDQRAPGRSRYRNRAENGYKLHRRFRSNPD